MSADKSKAAMLADKLDAMRDVDFDGVFVPAAAELRRILALETSLKRANAQAEHFERKWYLRGDQLEALEAERDQLHAEVMEQARLLGMSGERELALRAEIDRLRKDADALRADAERYRWLRSDDETVTGPCAYSSWMGLSMFTDELDSAIDAARTLK